ncbi:hypothetical protein LSTR_LSTR011270 [Laodelphax striatellus]|uniref:Uncharacterized protein n=1 Tax=Laodelphax striatellus TaxID=195883 RepID=A0A482WSL0_LAOST|nr:hypothetical protein LSTR_LSTR011270 [Laodelphax striatellus]
MHGTLSYSGLKSIDSLKLQDSEKYLYLSSIPYRNRNLDIILDENFYIMLFKVVLIAALATLVHAGVDHKDVVNFNCKPTHIGIQTCKSQLNEFFVYTAIGTPFDAAITKLEMAKICSAIPK